MQPLLSRSLRRAYREWVEDQIEAYKEEVPRGVLLDLADEVCSDLRVTRDGQYQITELLLCATIDRRIFRHLKLPGYRSWCARLAAGTLSPAIPESAPVEERRTPVIAVGRIAPLPEVLNVEPQVCVA